MYLVTITRHTKNGIKEKVITKLYKTVKPILNLYNYENSYVYLVRDENNKVRHMKLLKYFRIQKIIVDKDIALDQLIN